MGRLGRFLRKTITQNKSIAKKKERKKVLRMNSLEPGLE